jgi:hypothetical protein
MWLVNFALKNCAALRKLTMQVASRAVYPSSSLTHAQYHSPYLSQWTGTLETS